MRVLICGGRDYTNQAKVRESIQFLRGAAWAKHERLLIIHGACKTGADAIADKVCGALDVEVTRFPADWDGPQGRGAGPARNQQMLDEGLPDLVWAFPGGRGTAGMVRLAKEAGVRVIEVQP